MKHYAPICFSTTRSSEIPDDLTETASLNHMAVQVHPSECKSALHLLVPSLIRLVCSSASAAMNWNRTREGMNVREADSTPSEDESMCENSTDCVAQESVKN